MPRLGFLVALPDEAKSLVPRPPAFDAVVRLGNGHHLVVSGSGPVHAEQGARLLLDTGVMGLVSWGCAAALAPSLHPGDLLIPKNVIDTSGAAYAVDPQWHANLIAGLPESVTAHCGNLVESCVIIASPADKRILFDKAGAAGLDMESAAVARTAAAAGLPFLVIRTIADHAGAGIPASVLAALTPKGDVQIGRLLGYALRHPGQFIELARLGRAFGAAMASLKTVARAAGPADFYFPLAADLKPPQQSEP